MTRDEEKARELLRRVGLGVNPEAVVRVAAALAAERAAGAQRMRDRAEALCRRRAEGADVEEQFAYECAADEIAGLEPST